VGSRLVGLARHSKRLGECIGDHLVLAVSDVGRGPLPAPCPAGLVHGHRGAADLKQVNLGEQAAVSFL
jgi:hypothetical protein